MVGFFLCVCKITICLPSHTPTLYMLPLGCWWMLSTNWYISVECRWRCHLSTDSWITDTAQTFVWGLWHQKQVFQVGISNYISLYSVGCDYLSLPEIPVPKSSYHDAAYNTPLQILWMNGQFLSLRPRQNGNQSADDIFKCIFWNDS